MQGTLVAKRPLTGYHLKLIALITMFIDHIGAVFFPQLRILRAIGRISFPIYVFLAAEGCRYTSSRWKYMLRLGLFALISELPYDLALHPGLPLGLLNRTNVFYTLFLAVVSVQIFDTLRRQSRAVQIAGAGSLAAFIGAFYLLYLIANSDNEALIVVLVNVVGYGYTPLMLLACYWLEKRSGKDVWKKPGWVSNALALIPLAIPLYLSHALGCSYGVLGVLAVFLAFVARSRKEQAGVLALWALCFYGLRAVDPLLQGEITPAYMAARLILTLATAAMIYFAYNGQRGRRAKWAFYAAYPVHLAILVVLRWLLWLLGT